MSTKGLRTSMIPIGNEGVELEFDFTSHQLDIHTTTGQQRAVPLQPQSVADFHQSVLDAMDSVGMPVTINPMPNEIPDAIPFDHDTARRSYEPDHAHALWRALVQIDRVFTDFRAGFKGKASPVHFFWGSFDLTTAIAADDPDAVLASFFESTHAAAAELARWDRTTLECDHPEGPEWWRTRPHPPA